MDVADVVCRVSYETPLFIPQCTYVHLQQTLAP